MRPYLGAREVRQKPSHSRLLRTAGGPPYATGRARASRVDAIIVPASRPASSMSEIITLSARLDTLLVVLCSKQARPGQIAARVASTPRARALIVDMPTGFHPPDMPSRTSSAQFTGACGGRASDLSTKRNLGLLLARLNGWTKIVFLDDDITLSPTGVFARIARQLERSQIVGMVCRDFPDNSVICHARRLAELPQDNFVSGSVLGVHCGDLPLPFFPDIYNEDWFFFSKAVARHDLISVGDAVQAPYEPFRSPERARREEFGDLLAEGLYSLIGDINDSSLPYYRLLGCAGSAFWSDFIGARRELLKVTREGLRNLGAHLDGNGEGDAALRSLAVAEAQLDEITPDLCTAFLDAWQDDLSDWESICGRTSNINNMQTAMDRLGDLPWRQARFGDAHAAVRE